MESVELDMEDIFETGGDLDEDIPAPPPMPDLVLDDDGPLNQNGAGTDGEEEGEGGDVLAKLKDISKGAAKKRVMRPQPKLDIERLKSKRGLSVLPKLFKDVKFKGKGHEAEDLGLLMGKLEHWAHRLFPKIPFDDFIERLEKLGGKKPVQTCIKRIRLDMAINDEDDVQRGEDEDEPEAGPADVGGIDAEEAYEEMMRQEREKMEQEKSRQCENGETTPSNSQSSIPSPVSSPNRGNSSQNNPASGTHGASVRKESSVTSTGALSPAPGLTAEQLARMERNRQLALERRLAKLGQTPTASSPTTNNRVSNEASNQKAMQGKKNTGQTTPELDSEDGSLHLHLTESELTCSTSQQRHTQPANNSQSAETLSGDSNVSSQTPSEQLHLKLDATESMTAASVSGDSSEGLRLQLTETPEVDLGQTQTDHCKQTAGDNITETDLATEPERELKLKLSVTDDEDGMQTESE